MCQYIAHSNYTEMLLLNIKDKIKYYMKHSSTTGEKIENVILGANYSLKGKTIYST